MGFCRFIYDNKWLSGTALDASTENANFPASNTRHRWFTRTWRSVGLNGAGEWVRLNRGSSSPAITAAAIRFNNFSNGAVVNLQGGGDGNTWGGYDEAWSVNNKVMVHFPATPQSLDWWRVLVVDAGNSDGFSEIGCMFLGTYYQPVRNFNYGMSLNKEDPSLISFSEGGQLSSIFREKYFNKEYGFEHFKTTEMEAFNVVFDIVGYSKGFIFVEDVDDAYNTSYYVRITNFKWKFVTYDNWSLTMALEELR